MIRPRYILTVMLIIVISALLRLQGAGLTSPGNATKVSPSQTSDVLVERSELLPEGDKGGSEVKEPDAFLVQAQQDGWLILEHNCIRCHQHEWLEEINRSRSEWQVAFARMEAYGVILSETEKIILFDYLRVESR